MTSVICVLGAGGHAKVVIEAAVLSGWESAEIFDDDPAKWDTSILGFPVRGPIDAFLSRAAERRVHCAIGSNRSRHEIRQKYNIGWETIRHPAAVVSSSATINAGTFIGALATIQAGARIGDQVIINTGAIIEHDVNVSDCAHIAPGAVLAGDVSIGVGTLVGLGAKILPGIHVGAWAQIGAGAVVTKDVLSQTVMGGIPARQLRPMPVD